MIITPYVHRFFMDRIIHSILNNLPIKNINITMFSYDKHSYLKELNHYRQYFIFGDEFDAHTDTYNVRIQNLRENFDIDNLILTNLSNKLKIIYSQLPEFHDIKCIISGGILSHLFDFTISNCSGEYYKENFDIDVFVYGRDANLIAEKMEFPNYELKFPGSSLREDYMGNIILGNPEMFVFYSKKTIKFYEKDIPINLVVRPKYDKPEQIINGFDFEHCKPYWCNQTQKLYISKEQFDSIKRKKLVGKPNTEKRLKKYMDRGWTY